MKNSYLTIRNSRTRGRLAFTLVELLLVIAIIAVLASMAVGVMAQAQNDSAISATRSRIQILESLFETELENYEVRRSPVPLNVIGSLVNNVPDATWADSGPSDAAFLLHVKNMKRMIMADVIRAEMPEGSVPAVPELVFPTPPFSAYLSSLGLDPRVLVRYAPKSVYRWTGRTVDSAAANSENLYTILSRIDLDGTPAVDTLGSAAIGDSDGDGELEIVDAWGEPIVFQFRQQVLAPSPDPSTAPISRSGVWAETGSTTGLAVTATMPVQIPQIRIHFTSERLREIDGEEANYAGPPIDFF